MSALHGCIARSMASSAWCQLLITQLPPAVAQILGVEDKLLAKFDANLRNVGNACRLWAMQHFLKPVPDRDTKLRLGEYTRCTERQIGDWFTNWRARRWRPALQKMASDMGGGEEEEEEDGGAAEAAPAGGERRIQRRRRSSGNAGNALNRTCADSHGALASGLTAGLPEQRRSARLKDKPRISVKMEESDYSGMHDEEQEATSPESPPPKGRLDSEDTWSAEE